MESSDFVASIASLTAGRDDAWSRDDVRLQRAGWVSRGVAVVSWGTSRRWKVGVGGVACIDSFSTGGGVGGEGEVVVVTSGRGGSWMERPCSAVWSQLSLAR